MVNREGYYCSTSVALLLISVSALSNGAPARMALAGSLMTEGGLVSQAAGPQPKGEENHGVEHPHPRLEVPARLWSRATSMMFSGDGRWLWVGYLGYDHSKVVCWDLSTGTPVRTFRTNGEDARHVTFSPDGRHVLTFGDIGTVALLWHANSGKRLGKLDTAPHSLTSAVFTSDSRHILTGDILIEGMDLARKEWKKSGRITVWDVGTTERVRTFRPSATGIEPLAVSADGRYVVSGGARTRLVPPHIIGTVTLWDFTTGTPIRQFRDGMARVKSVALSRDGRRLLACSWSVVVLWDVATGKKLQTLRGHKGAAVCAVFSHDSDHVLSGGGFLYSALKGYQVEVLGPGEAFLWAARSGKLLQSYGGHTSQLTCVAFSPDSKRVATACSREIRIWDTTKGRELVCLMSIGKAQDWIATTPDGYFDGSKRAQEVLQWRVNHRVFPAERYAKELHRPGIAARALNQTAPRRNPDR